MKQEAYTVHETVRETRYCSKHIRDLLYSGRIEGAKKVGRQWRIPAASVKALKERNQGVGRAQ